MKEFLAMQDDIVIVGAARTPVGAFNGAFANLPAHELGKVAIKAALERAGVEGAQVSEVIMGQILSAGQGQNPARQASIAAGIPVESPAWGVNQLCGSGLRTVALGYHMGNTAENVAKQYQITRAQQDAFAVGSQNKAEAAQKAGKFKDEIAPVTIKTRKGDRKSTRLNSSHGYIS